MKRILLAYANNIANLKTSQTGQKKGLHDEQISKAGYF
jgi:hypothetical protein